MICENNRNYRSLELNKVLELLSDETGCDDAKEKALKLEPEYELEEVKLSILHTSDAHMLMARYGSPSFGGLKNINSQLTRTAAGGSASMRELLDVAETLRVIRSISEWRENGKEAASSLDVYFNCLNPNKYLESKIFESIISEDEMSDNASKELFDIRRKMRSESSKIRDQLDKMIRSVHYQKYLQDSIVTMRDDRFVVPVKSEHRGNVPGLVHDTSSSGATVFIEPMSVVEANNAIKILKSKEETEIERILYALSAETGEFSDNIKLSYDNLVELNLIFAKARLAYKMKAVAPTINDNGVINLKNARHPLIDAKKVKPIDIRLGEDFDILVITGPNTGGKTVSIKTLGLLTLMTMCGLMIPVSDQSQISIFKNVLADIGDEQSIEQSLSTFSAHMSNIIEIMKKSDERSLVLLDELGAGTDPVEGAALAMAILENIKSKGSKIAATTHYAELKAYALQTEGVENGACEFDVSTLSPTYRLLIGAPGRSNAFAISERLGLDEGVVDRARELLSAETLRFENVVEKLELSRQEMETAKREADRLNEEARKAKHEADYSRKNMERIREKEIEKARGEAKQIVEKAKRDAEALIMELEILRKRKNTENISELAARAKSELRSKVNKLDDHISPISDLEDDNYTLPRDLRVGDIVYLKDLSKEGEVIAVPNKSGDVQVQIGLMKTKVKLDRLRLLGSKKKEPSSTRKVTKAISNKDAELKLQLDLRGKMVEEALMDVDSFIDSALIRGVKDLVIVHGKGTGALRSAVQQHLRKHSMVRVFRLGTYGEGEDGVTILELK